MKLKSLFVMWALLLCLVPTQAATRHLQAKPTPATDSQKLNQLLDDAWQDYLRFNPITATAIGDHRYDDQFANDISDDFRAQEKEIFMKYMRELVTIDRNALVGQDRLSYDTFKFQTQTAFEGYNFRLNLTPINQFSDATSTFAQLASGRSLHPFKTVKNY